jgi:hypothetical protein
MSAAADMAASAEKKAATGAEIGAGFQFAAAIGTLFTPTPGGAPPAAPANYNPNQLSGLY